MSMFRKGSGREQGHRISARSAGFFDYESEVLSEDEYAWSWTIARAFVEHFNTTNTKDAAVSAQYEKGLLGSCRWMGDIRLRPSLRGQEAWRTLFHELAHVITPQKTEDHGEEWRNSLKEVHDLWKAWLPTLTGALKDEVIQMVLGYGRKRGHAIGMDEGTDQWGRPKHS
jgi:hypothetical protein